MLREQFEFFVRRNYENHAVLAGAVDFAVGGDGRGAEAVTAMTYAFVKMFRA